MIVRVFGTHPGAGPIAQPECIGSALGPPVGRWVSEGPARETLSEYYRRNRAPLFAFWLGGEAALDETIAEDSGVRLLVRYAKLGDPTALSILAKQCCGNPPTDVNLGGEGVRPGLVFAVVTAEGDALAVPPIPGLARAATGALPVPAADPEGPTP